MIVELHILQNFAPSCLNRDDTNSPKECLFGGYRRARISSQCIKRAIRGQFKDNSLVSPDTLAKRTKLLVKELAKRLVAAGKQEEAALNASKLAIEKTNKLKIKDKEQTEYLLFLGEKEIANIADVILSHWDELNSSQKNEKALESIGKEVLDKFTGGKSTDLSLFGRMLADLPGKNTDAACQVAHAISTHKVGVEFDFYTAVDDLQTEEETGAGMMGTIEFNSACYYRYANIDIEQLKTNLVDNELAKKTVEAFIRAAKDAVPSGKQTSFSAQNPPDFVMAVVRDSGTWSLANAFAKPVKENGDLVTNSIEALIKYWNILNNAYPTDSILAKPVLSLKETSTEGLQKVNNFEELVAVVNKAIASDC
jgi:CRISPR system Cascade subunit CasC